MLWGGDNSEAPSGRCDIWKKKTVPRGMSERFQDWSHKGYISNPDYKRQTLPFAVIPLVSNASSKSYLPCLCTFLEGFFQDPPQLWHHCHFDIVPSLKIGLLDDHHELGKEREGKKSHGACSGELGGSSSTEIYSTCQGTIEWSVYCKHFVTSCAATILVKASGVEQV